MKTRAGSMILAVLLAASSFLMMAPTEGSEVRLFAEASKYKTGDTVLIMGVIEDKIITEWDYVVIEIFNPKGTLVRTDTIDFDDDSRNEELSF